MTMHAVFISYCLALTKFCEDVIGSGLQHVPSHIFHFKIRDLLHDDSYSNLTLSLPCSVSVLSQVAMTLCSYA